MAKLFADIRARVEVEDESSRQTFQTGEHTAYHRKLELKLLTDILRLLEAIDLMSRQLEMFKNRQWDQRMTANEWMELYAKEAAATCDLVRKLSEGDK